MAEMFWAHVDSISVRTLFKGIRLRTLWTSESGASAQFLEMDPGSRWQGEDLHQAGPQEVFVVSGVFNDGVRDYPAGSFIHAPRGTAHVPQTKTGCTLFLFFPEG